MRKLNQENGQTFIIVTHSSAIGEQTDRIIWMKDGLIEQRPELITGQELRTNGQSSGYEKVNSQRVPELQIAVQRI